jgi:hypothetical protein
MLNCISEWEMVDHKLNGSKYIILGNKKGGGELELVHAELGIRICLRVSVKRGTCLI